MIESMTHTLVVHQMRADNCFAYLIEDGSTRDGRSGRSASRSRPGVPARDRGARAAPAPRDRDTHACRSPVRCGRASRPHRRRGAALGPSEVRGRDAPASGWRSSDSGRPRDRGHRESRTHRRLDQPARRGAHSSLATRCSSGGPGAPISRTAVPRHSTRHCTSALPTCPAISPSTRATTTLDARTPRSPRSGAPIPCCFSPIATGSSPRCAPADSRNPPTWTRSSPPTSAASPRRPGSPSRSLPPRLARRRRRSWWMCACPRSTARCIWSQASCCRSTRSRAA